MVDRTLVEARGGVERVFLPETYIIFGIFLDRHPALATGSCNI